MPTLEVAIRDISTECAKAGQVVSEVLAAFVTRTIVEAHPKEFGLSKELTSKAVNRLVSLATERLLEKDAPSLETVKMQVGFDCVYVALEDDMARRKEQRLESVRGMTKAIVSTLPRNGADFDALTSLYRMVFAYLMAHFDASRDLPPGKLAGWSGLGPGGPAPGTEAAAVAALGGAGSSGGAGSGGAVGKDRNVEREVAAALESVFPRIGLKSFVMLAPAQKTQQLAEMANIVLGIRLFNKEIGKGGAGLDDVDEDALAAANELAEQLVAEVADAEDLCLSYQEVLVFVGVSKQHAEKLGVTRQQVNRWSAELANRRQYLAYLVALAEDVQCTRRRVLELQRAYQTCLADLQSMVGEKASVPKEHVYPKFEATATTWLEVVAEARVVRARQAALADLHTRNAGFHATLAGDSQLALEAKEAARGGGGYSRYHGNGGVRGDEGGAFSGAVTRAEGSRDNALNSGGGEFPALGGTSAFDKGTGMAELIAGNTASGGGRGGGATKHGAGNDDDDDGGDVPIVLTAENAGPEFLQLPLEYQGFCPWTVVHQHGFLLPGKPAEGVVRYNNRFYVFANAAARDAFVAEPMFHVRGVAVAARHSPELIHLLRIQDEFPDTSIPQLIADRNSRAGAAAMGSLGSLDPEGSDGGLLPRTRDAGTETPTHFVEKHLDVNYEWNEWALRRRALQMSNVRKCVTDSAQTDLSHFRRDNDSQVYLPAVKVTQTRKEQGTQPPMVTSYVAGLRGTPDERQMPSKYVAGSRKGKEPTGTLHLVLEPGSMEGHKVIGGRSRAF